MIAGYATFATTGVDMIAVRFNADGSTDTSFGTSGVANVDVNNSGEADHAYAAALAPDGSIVLAGDGNIAGTAYMSAARLDPGGALDTTFEGDGKATPFTTAVSAANAVAVDGLGRVTMAGQVIRTGSENDFLLGRLNPDGSVDSTFGSSGKVQTNFATNRDDVAYAVALTAAGGAVAAGGSATGGSGDFAVARYAPGGTATPQRLYALQDANYNVTALVNTSGSVVQRFTYEPYGQSTVLSSAWGSASDGYDWAFRFQGGRLETATGNYLFNVGGHGRDYNSSQGRWLQIDSRRYYDGMNLYQYVSGNPSSLLDPTGTRAIQFGFDAFINGRLENWLPEPSSTPLGLFGIQSDRAEFDTKRRGFGAFNFDQTNANAKIYHFGFMESTKIGTTKIGPGTLAMPINGQTTVNSPIVKGEWQVNAGAGLSRQRVRPSFYRAGGFTYSTPLRTKAHGTIEVSNPGPCQTLIRVTNAGNYPYLSGTSPDINYDVSFLFTDNLNGWVTIFVSGSHNQFPDYEAYADGGLTNQYAATASGPGIYHLNAPWKFTGSVTVPK